MLDEAKLEKLNNMLGAALYELKDAVDAAVVQFNEESVTAIGVSDHFEDIATSLNSVIQITSLLGYFELVQEGDDPLERM